MVEPPVLSPRRHNARPLSTFKRTFSTTTRPLELDKDSDEWELSEWPPSQPDELAPSVPALNVQTQATGSAARSNAHWAAKAAPNNKPSEPVPGKRTYPWDHVDQSKAEKRFKSTAFHQLAPLPGGLGGGAHARTESTGSTGSLGRGGGGSANIRQRVILSPEQQEILRLVVDEGKSVFFTGSAGTGKSVLLREIIASLRKKYERKPDAISVTASTGMAACNIGGTTVHSFAGIGLGVEVLEQLIAKVKNPKNKKAAERWRRTLVLVIDEVSMVDGALFDKLDGIARAVRRKPEQPFGGMQLVVTGDFFQLPPVGKNGYMPKYAFEMAAWKEAIEVTVNLTQVFRQKDTVFIDMLNELRFGQLSSKSVERFVSLRRSVRYDDDIEPTQLCALRAEVDRANNERLISIKTPIRDFHAIDTGEGLDEEQRTKLLDNVMAPKKLSLKVGAQVMYLKNNPDMGLVNGTLGRVARFAPPGGGRKDDNEDLDSDDQGKPTAAPAKRSQTDVPWVEWNIYGRPTYPVEREDFKIEQNGLLKAKRQQYPLMLSWAVSIHKSQGQTLDRVRVDLRRIFEAGQAYVALSRATSMDRLEVTGFDPSKVTVNRKVLQWNATLKTF